MPWPSTALLVLAPAFHQEENKQSQHDEGADAVLHAVHNGYLAADGTVFAAV